MEQKNKLNKHIGKYKNIYLFLSIVLLLGVIGVVATTIITNNEIYTNYMNVTNISVGNLYFGEKLGAWNSTNASRPFTSNNQTMLYVCQDGTCAYNSIQEAIYDVPFLLRHHYLIYVGNGTYNEDIYIPSTITSFTTLTEGSVGGLDLIGNTTDLTQVKVKSIQVSGIVGAVGVKISGFEVFGKEPFSDENTSISIYGSSGVELQKVNITSNVKYAILAYTSKVNVNQCHFNGSQDHALFAKAMSTVFFGDSSSGAGNHGRVTSQLLESVNGAYVYMANNSVSYTNMSQYIHSLILDESTHRLYNVESFDRSLSIINPIVFKQSSDNLDQQLFISDYEDSITNALYSGYEGPAVVGRNQNSGNNRTLTIGIRNDGNFTDYINISMQNANGGRSFMNFVLTGVNKLHMNVTGVYVQNFLGFKPNATATCIEGIIVYNGTSHKHQGCNGTTFYDLY